MNRRQKIIVSITGIFIVMLALVGLTYAYFLTRITGNEEEKSISVTTANLELRYDDVTEDITLDGALPNTTRTKTFTVTNNGNAKVTDYQVYLENVVNELDRKDDLVYTLTCESSDEQNSPCTNKIDDETTFPSVNGVLLTNSLDTDDVHTYTLTLTYKEMNVDQSVDMNKRISAKINIYDKNDLTELTLGHYVLSNGALVEKRPAILNPDCVSDFGEEVCKEYLDYIYGDLSGESEIDKTYPEKTEITKVSDGKDMTDVGIFTAPDDYGTSYYYRGTVKNNYVNFAGFTWRIVRINGDGSIRLILDGSLDKICVEYNTDNTCKTYAGTTSAFNSSSGDNAYVGYMYGFTGMTSDVCIKTDEYGIKSIGEETEKNNCTSSGGVWTTPYDATHMNINDSTIKTKIDTFYETYIENGTTKQYEKYLADALFCNDKTLLTDSTTYNGFGKIASYYGAYYRLYNNGSFISSTNPATPTLKCASGAPNNYSRLTSNLETETTLSNGTSINNDLKHPIALLSADELVLAGAFKDETNTYYYLYDAYANGLSHSNWWLMSPCEYYYSYSITVEFLSNVKDNSFYGDNVSSFFGIRPVINLKSNLLIESGDGTSGNGAYKIRLAS